MHNGPSQIEGMHASMSSIKMIKINFQAVGQLAKNETLKWFETMKAEIENDDGQGAQQTHSSHSLCTTQIEK